MFRRRGPTASGRPIATSRRVMSGCGAVSVGPKRGAQARAGGRGREVEAASRQRGCQPTSAASRPFQGWIWFSTGLPEAPRNGDWCSSAGLAIRVAVQPRFGNCGHGWDRLGSGLARPASPPSRHVGVSVLRDPTTTTRAKHILSGVDPLGEVEQRCGDVGADDAVVRAAEAVHQYLLPGEVGRVRNGEAVASGCMDGEEIRARPTARRCGTTNASSRTAAVEGVVRWYDRHITSTRQGAFRHYLRRY